jgi:hypothetical protein
VRGHFQSFHLAILLQLKKELLQNFWQSANGLLSAEVVTPYFRSRSFGDRIPPQAVNFDFDKSPAPLPPGLTAPSEPPPVRRQFPRPARSRPPFPKESFAMSASRKSPRPARKRDAAVAACAGKRLGAIHSRTVASQTHWNVS